MGPIPQTVLIIGGGTYTYLTSKKKLNSVKGEIEAAGLGIQREKVLPSTSVAERDKDKERESAIFN